MLGRQFMREFRPFFRMFDESVSRPPSQWAAYKSPLEHPYFAAQLGLRPVVDLTQEGNNFILEADLPGVKKGDVAVSIGDNGTSVTIEGKYTRRIRPSEVESQSTTPESSFSRTISLPERVDGKSVTAQLADGILVVTIPKTSPEEADRVKVNIT